MKTPDLSININESLIDRHVIDQKFLFAIRAGVPRHDFEQIWKDFSNLDRWQFSMSSGGPDAVWTFWCVPFFGCDADNPNSWSDYAPRWLNPFTNDVIEMASQIVGEKLYLRRLFLNGYTYGQDGTIHRDTAAKTKGEFTLLYYPCFEWPLSWEGETVFYNESKDRIMASIPYSPNTFGLWDARIWHVGRSPSRICPELRMTLVWNLALTEEVH